MAWESERPISQGERETTGKGRENSKPAAYIRHLQSSHFLQHAVVSVEFSIMFPILFVQLLVSCTTF